jgi:hypothetical protein
LLFGKASPPSRPTNVFDFGDIGNLGARIDNHRIRRTNYKFGRRVDWA